MQMKIKSMSLYYFKGVNEAHYDFGDETVISGQNGAGKTTIATAFYWLMADKDYDLVSNPNIRPLGVEECTPRVEVVVDIDGKEVHLAKQQKRTVSKPNAEGISKVSLTNSYEINAVPKSERDFKAYLSELGVDFDKFLALSHPDVFMDQKSADMRKVLFSMASSLTDKEVAEKTSGAEQVRELLDNYTLDEVSAMHKATLRKVAENYGKDGELLRKQIEGLEQAKTDIDVAELELGKADAQRRLTEAENRKLSINNLNDESNRLSAEIMDLKFKQGNLSMSANAKNVEMRNRYNSALAQGMRDIDKCKAEISRYQTDIQITNDQIARHTHEKDSVADEWKKVKTEKFDDSSLVCPTCGQAYPEEKKEELKTDFEKKKQGRLDAIEKRGLALKSSIETCQQQIVVINQKISTQTSEMHRYEDIVKDFNERLAQLPDNIDVSKTDEYIAIQNQINAKIIQMEQMAKADTSAIDEEISAIHIEINGYDRQLAQADNNIRIDEQIQALLDKQAEYEQSKADAENILYQISLVSRKKNELLSEEINKNFELVNFKLFDYQKNGEIKDVCIPQTKDGKDMAIQTNTGLTVAMKIDIIKGLQKFYGQSYPVFLDGAECLSDNSLTLINMDCQMIYLKVTRNDRLLVDALRNNWTETIPQFDIDKKVED